MRAHLPGFRAQRAASAVTAVNPRAQALFGDYPPKELARFKEWHAANPHVYRQFKRNAYRIKATGREYYSAYPIFYHMRFEFDLQTTGDVFKINNNYLSMYIRLLIYNHPEFDGFFELREIRMQGILSMEERKRRDEEGYIH
jgi:hypothetical protein